ncbi:MAG TPA: UDP-glucose/GDP-mannose dehydrogenase family protein [Rickettsiales bacterium]|nr:UDP-glucose/GDP-mannose dehydrogenase family protein [Rickettsiales bacterium]
MKITIIGTGYVGLVSGVCFAKLGHDVICVDKDKTKINALLQGKIPIFEPDLQEILAQVIAAKKITFTTDLKTALKDECVVFIAVGTPQDEDGSADLSYVLACAKEIAQFSQNYKLIVTKSTVPVGTGAQIAALIAKTNANLDFAIASNPEFLREGCAINDFMNPDRIVIGANDEKSHKILREIYTKFADEKIVATDVITAELIKYAANSFLATKISFINEMADLCEKTGANIKNLSTAIGLDSRIGNKFLNVGPGFGGSCFPKDIKAIVNVAKEFDIKLSLIESVVDSNKIRIEKMTQKVLQNLQGERIALLGLAFKANTDDIRYSPALSIAKNLLEKGVKINAQDKEALENTKKELSDFKGITFFKDVYEAVANVDLIVIATEWDEYKNLDFDKIKKLVKVAKILDLRNILDEKTLEKKGFEYNYIGKKYD